MTESRLLCSSKQLVVSVSCRFTAFTFVHRQQPSTTVEWLGWQLWWPRTTQRLRLLHWCWS